MWATPGGGLFSSLPPRDFVPGQKVGGKRLVACFFGENVLKFAGNFAVRDLFMNRQDS